MDMGEIADDCEGYAEEDLSRIYSDIDAMYDYHDRVFKQEEKERNEREGRKGFNCTGICGPCKNFSCPNK